MRENIEFFVFCGCCIVIGLSVVRIITVLA